MWAVPSFSKTEFEDCGKQRLCDVVLCVRVKLPVYESGEIYVPPVMLQMVLTASGSPLAACTIVS